MAYKTYYVCESQTITTLTLNYKSPGFEPAEEELSGLPGGRWVSDAAVDRALDVRRCLELIVKTFRVIESR